MFDIIKAWNSYCLKNNNILDCIYPVNAISEVKKPYKYYKILPYEPFQKTYSTLTDAINDIEFNYDFSQYVNTEFELMY